MLSDEERERVGAPLERAWTLPPRAYTDPAMWEAEVEAIFRREWVCVGRAEQLDEVSQLAVEVAGQPIVLTRDREGVIRALPNVCLHRSMPLIEGSDTGRFITCPYHLWTYSLDGRLRTAPLMDGADGFDVADHCLRQLPVEVWEGFVLVCLADDPPPLAPVIEPLRQVIERYRVGELRMAGTLDFDSPWNWKLLVENFMEAYHHIGPHRNTFQPVYPAAQSSVLDNEGGPWSLLRMPGVRGDEHGTGREGLPFFRDITPDERSQLQAVCVFPTLLFALSGSIAIWYHLLPRAHDTMHLQIHILLEPEVLERPEVVAILPETLESAAHLHAEDIPVNEGPWRGLQAPLTGQGRLSPLEKSIWQLNQFWLSRLDAIG